MNKLASYIDHTCLAPEAGQAEIELLCEQGMKYGFAAVCVNINHVKLTRRILEGDGVGQALHVCAAVSFPLGVLPMALKRTEVQYAIEHGATEVDMPVYLPAAKAKDRDYLMKDLAALAEPCQEAGVVSKLIFETACLDIDSKILLCELANELGIDFLKTSTGLHKAGGATIEDVKLLSEHRGGCKVKASGGIRTVEDFKAMIDAGADRIGTSSGVAIVEALKTAQS